MFDDFCHANDPHQEHDSRYSDADGHTIMFKIEYYEKTLTCHSPDPADPSVTERVITIMLAEQILDGSWSAPVRIVECAAYSVQPEIALPLGAPGTRASTPIFAPVSSTRLLTFAMRVSTRCPRSRL